MNIGVAGPFTQSLNQFRDFDIEYASKSASDVCDMWQGLAGQLDDNPLFLVQLVCWLQETANTFCAMKMDDLDGSVVTGKS